MHPEVYDQFARVTEGHWWLEARQALLSGMLECAGVVADGTHRVLEIGSGVGGEHAFLGGYGPVTGVELAEEGLVHCRRRGYHALVEADLNGYAPPPGAFDLLVDQHVLYHRNVDDPARVLTQLAAGLAPGGVAVLTEPAHELLRRRHDEAVMGARRFSRAQMQALVSGAGLHIERMTGFTSLLVPVVMAGKLREQLVGGAESHVEELESLPRVIDRGLRAVMGLERGMLRRVSLPFGTAWAVLARRGATTRTR